MLDNPLLNICIGLIFLFLLLSIITTALQEVVANLLSLRGKYLIKAIRAMIADGGTRAEFFKHPLIYSLFRGKLKPTPSSEEPKRPPSSGPELRQRRVRRAPRDRTCRSRRRCREGAAERGLAGQRGGARLRSGGATAREAGHGSRGDG